jgi:CRP-like cAMP-binding protein
MSLSPELGTMDVLDPENRAIHSTLRQYSALPLAVEPHVDIYHEGDRPEFVYLIQSGWLYSYSMLADGQRQILYLHKAGDIVGLCNLGCKRAISSLHSARDCVLRPIPISAFSSPSFLTASVATFLLHKTVEMQSILMRTLMSVGRMAARERIIWLLLMLHDRLGNASGPQTVELPLNQTELGDLIGLSNVSICKNMCQLSNEGYIVRKGDTIVLRRYAEMCKMVGYEPLELRSQPVPEKTRSPQLMAS